MNSESTNLVFRIQGMDCAEEIAILKRALGPLVDSEEQLAFDILNGKLIVSPGTKYLSNDAVIQAVERTGMKAEVWTDGDGLRSESGFWQRFQRVILTTVSGSFGVLGFLIHAWLAGGFSAALGSEGMGLAYRVLIPAVVLYLIGIAAGIWYVLPKAWRAAIRLRPDMNLLMTKAVSGAASIGDWFEAVTG